MAVVWIDIMSLKIAARDDPNRMQALLNSMRHISCSA